VALGMLFILILWCSLNYLDRKYEKHQNKNFFDPFDYSLTRVKAHMAAEGSSSESVEYLVLPKSFSNLLPKKD
jgi:hypothetical protein